LNIPSSKPKKKEKKRKISQSIYLCLFPMAKSNQTQKKRKAPSLLQDNLYNYTVTPSASSFACFFFKTITKKEKKKNGTISPMFFSAHHSPTTTILPVQKSFLTRIPSLGTLHTLTVSTRVSARCACPGGWNWKPWKRMGILCVRDSSEPLRCITLWRWWDFFVEEKEVEEGEAEEDLERSKGWSERLGGEIRGRMMARHRPREVSRRVQRGLDDWSGEISMAKRVVDSPRMLWPSGGC
jgi:hypothetical protein